MILRRYTATDGTAWDAFVRTSKNGWFMFERAYMDYHADRFTDHSLLVYDDKDRLIALLPANQRDSALVSHGGLSYGGFITDERMRTPLMQEVFDHLRVYGAEQGIDEIDYKAIPYTFHRLPADEDLYALHVNGAELVGRRMLSVIDQRAPLKFAQRRLRGVKKAMQGGVLVNASDDLANYWALLDDVLRTRHRVHPAHSRSEIELLRKRFPDNIRLFTATAGSELAAGVLVYSTKEVARAQYIASSEQGKELGALDLLFDHLIHDVYADKRYFDFGASTGSADDSLNVGLITQKEEFGGRAVVCDTYRVRI